MSDKNQQDGVEDGETQILAQLSELKDNNSAVAAGSLSFIGGSSHTSHSLNVLESDLRALHSKWQAVEKVIANRDERINDLEGGLTKTEERCATLEAAIDALSDEKSSLLLELENRVSELQHLNNQCDELTRLADEREKALLFTERDNSSLEEDKRRINAELTDKCRQIAETRKHMDELENGETALRVEIQELKDYIDGRKTEWQRQTEKLQAYEETINGMHDSLESHNSIVASKEHEKAELSNKIMGLERQLAETRGKYAEKESSYESLKQSLDTQTKELGNLSAETIRRNKDIERLSKKLKRRDSSIDKLQGELKTGKRDRLSLEEQLSVDRTTITDLQAKLNLANERVADFEANRKQRDTTVDELSKTVGALRERLKSSEPTIEAQQETIADMQEKILASEEREEALREQVDSLTAKLKKMSHQATEQEIHIAETDAVMLETRTELKNVEEELEAQRDLVKTLEKELIQKQNDLDLLDRNVERLHAIGSDVRVLDMQIDDVWNRKPKDASGEESHDTHAEVDELVGDDLICEHQIVVENGPGKQSTRRILADGVSTIGRSKGNDIRVASKYISRLHARITVDGASATIEDAGSTNGFFVNSMQTRHHALSNGDVLEIGDCKFRYSCAQIPAGTADRAMAPKEQEKALHDGMH
ncbi:MAG: FHA domain-containing protein [Woeseia sp.]